MQIIFKIMGGLMLFFAAALLFVGTLVMMGYSPRHAPAVTLPLFGLRLSIVILLNAVIGIGLLKLRKWAALALSILALYPAYWSLMNAIHPMDSGPGDWNWLGFLYAVLLIIPLVVTVKYWKMLVWRGPIDGSAQLKQN